MPKKKMQVDPLSLPDDLVIRVAAEENNIRRWLANTFEEDRAINNLNVSDVAHCLEISQVQARRLLHKEVGGVLELKTILRAADFFGFRLNMQLEKRAKQ